MPEPLGGAPSQSDTQTPRTHLPGQSGGAGHLSPSRDGSPSFLPTLSFCPSGSFIPPRPPWTPALAHHGPLRNEGSYRTTPSSLPPSPRLTPAAAPPTTRRPHRRLPGSQGARSAAYPEGPTARFRLGIRQSFARRGVALGAREGGGGVSRQARRQERGPGAPEPQPFPAVPRGSQRSAAPPRPAPSGSARPGPGPRLPARRAGPWPAWRARRRVGGLLLGGPGGAPASASARGPPGGRAVAAVAAAAAARPAGSSGPKHFTIALQNC